MIYNNFKYIYPPRPELKIPFSALDKYDNHTFLGQPKMNGSCSIIFMNEFETKIFNRHKNTFSSFK